MAHQEAVKINQKASRIQFRRVVSASPSGAFRLVLMEGFTRYVCGSMDTHPWTREQGRAKEIADNDGIRQHSAAGSWSGITRRPGGLRFEAVAQTKPNPAQHFTINELLEELKGG